MKVLITGGAGFIGSHVAKRLLGRGDEVILVDNLCDYYDVNLKKDRLKNLEHDNMIFYDVDITNYDDMDNIFKNHNVDKVCHLAAQAGVRYSLTHPFVYENTNGLGTLNMLELCRHNDVKDFVYASSSSVYGGNEKMPFSEKDNVDTPISLYAATKKYNELQANVYHKLYGLNTTGLRFFTVYGPWGRPDMALFLFTDAIKKGEAIKVFNNGKMRRDFTYVEDIVSGVVASLDKAYPCEVFNLARGEEILLMDFINEIEINLGREAIKEMMPIQAGDVPATSADISKAKKMLGYEPKTSVKEGIKNFVEWYNEYYSND